MAASVGTVRRGSAAGVVGVIGGSMLVAGSFLTWATASIDVNAFAGSLGVDPALVAGALSTTSVSATGMSDGADGVFTLIAGALAFLVAVLAFAVPSLGRLWGALLVAAGLVGAAVAGYDGAQLDDVKQAAIAGTAPVFEGTGIDPGILSDIFDVKVGAGLIVCLVGGLVVVAAGVIALTRGVDPPLPASPTPTALETGMEPPPAASAPARPVDPDDPVSPA